MRKYFVPCILAHASEFVDQVACSSLVPPLLVSFECGYCPKGVAGALPHDKRNEIFLSLDASD